MDNRQKPKQHLQNEEIQGIIGASLERKKRCSMNTETVRTYYVEYESATGRIRYLEKENAEKDSEIARLQRVYEIERREKERLLAEAAEYQAQIEALKREVARLHGILDQDGTNSGTPTSKTPLNKEKVIPNTREKTGKKRGGQHGHPKSKLKGFEDHEVTETEVHGYKCCPICGGKLREIGTEIHKDELDYKVVVIKRRHYFPDYVCIECGKRFRQAVPDNLKEENQYGKDTQALALSLVNIGNVSIRKTGRIICGLSQGEVYPTDGYIAKLQRRASESLRLFMLDLKMKILLLAVVYWDDTVIFIDKKRACLRFYGDESLALYFAHEHKDKAGIDEDGILPNLPETAKVMHDHNKVNYNDDYSFQNIECCAHLLRDLQKAADRGGRKWAKDMKEHIQTAIHDRKEVLKSGKERFEAAYIEKFFIRFNQIIIEANIEHDKNPDDAFYQEEDALIRRLLDYKDNYFAWVTCFDLPVTNNLSERSLRDAKTHMKVSGQFQSKEYASYYATIRSYIETCRRNGLNEMTALSRLLSGNPLTVDEILGNSRAE